MIPSKIKDNIKYSHTYKAYVYYYFTTKTDLHVLMDNGLYFMKNNKIDVVNCIKQYNNHLFIDKLHFKEGSGGLNFYLFNWKCPPIKDSDMGFIMT